MCVVKRKKSERESKRSSGRNGVSALLVLVVVVVVVVERWDPSNVWTPASTGRPPHCVADAWANIYI